MSGETVVALPAGIQRELDEAEEIEKQLAGEQGGQDDDPSLVPEETPPAPIEDPPVLEDLGSAASAEETPPSGEDWEQKYKTLQSKYDTEVPRLHQQNKDLALQVADIQRQLLTSTTPPEEEAPAARAAGPLVTEKDEEEFGADLLDVQRRVAREEMGDVLTQNQQLREQVQQLTAQLQEVSATTQANAQHSFDDQLTGLVPDWKKIDETEGWLNWLREVDPMSGVPRQNHLNQAVQMRNAQHTADIFNAYLATTAQPKPKATTENPELARQVSPQTTSAGATPVEPPAGRQKVWTQDEIAAALDPRRLRNMNADEIAAVMAEIDKASAEGRIKP